MEAGAGRFARASGPAPPCGQSSRMKPRPRLVGRPRLHPRRRLAGRPRRSAPPQGLQPLAGANSPLVSTLSLTPSWG